MEVNVCKNCANYRADGDCGCQCERWNEARETVIDYCFKRAGCDGCPLRLAGCSRAEGYRHQALVQVAEALQTYKGREWLADMKSSSDLYRVMGMVTDMEAYNKRLAAEERKDSRIAEVAKLLQELGSDVCCEAAQYLTEYKDIRWEERNLD